jgi:hypothetical protein
MTRFEIYGILIGAPIGTLIALTVIWIYDRKEARRG